MITVKEGDVDIGLFPLFTVIISALSSSIGANPSAEEQEEGLEDGATTVNNVVHSFRLQQTTFDKKSFLSYLKVIIAPYSWSIRLILSYCCCRVT
jgi:Translationally controlled tumour protein